MRLCSTVCLPGFLHGIDQPHKFLNRMRDRNIVVFALRTLFGKIGRKVWIPKANILRGIEKSIA